MYQSKYNKENIDTLLNMSIPEFFDHLEGITVYEDMEVAAHKDQEAAMKRDRN